MARRQTHNVETTVVHNLRTIAVLTDLQNQTYIESLRPDCDNRESRLLLVTMQCHYLIAFSVMHGLIQKRCD